MRNTRTLACYAVSVSGCCNVRRTGATAPKSQESFRGARAPCAPLVPPPMLQHMYSRLHNKVSVPFLLPFHFLPFYHGGTVFVTICHHLPFYRAV